MNLNGRSKLYLWFCLFAVAFLISTLPSLALRTSLVVRPSTPFEPNLIGQISFALIPFYLIVVLLFLLPLLYSRKTFIAILFLGGFLLLVAWITSALGQLPPPTFPTAVPQGSVKEEIIEEATPAPLPPSEEAETPSTPAWFITAVPLLLLFILICAVGYLVWTFWPREPTFSPFTEISREAEIALADLASGGDFNDAILRCYQQMTETINLYRGVDRAKATTAREFEQTLLHLGLPEEPVMTLTRLFEAARYSAEGTPTESEAVAIDSLTAVIAACKEAL